MTFTDSYFPADRSEPELALTVGELLRRAADAAPHQLALIEGTPVREKRRRWTYQELLTEAEAGARALLDRFDRGDHIAILAPNQGEWTLVQLSAALAGLVLVTVNPALRAGEVRYILDQSDSVGLVLADRYRDQDLVGVVATVREELPNLREVIRLADWSDFVASGSESVELPSIDPQEPAMIQYTSGTTGLPKGALLAHQGIVNAGNLIPKRIERSRGDVWLNPLPMFHTGGCVMGTLGTMASFSAQIMVTEFDPALVLQLIEEEQPTYVLGVPTMVLALMEHPDFVSRDTSSIQVFSSGGSTVPPELVRRIEEGFRVTFNMAFGQTESSSVILMTRLDSTPEQKADTLGIPLPNLELMIADENGNPVPINTQGEICCRGWGVMLGYYKMPEATAEAIDENGWLHTGDLGVMDTNGYTRITGRIKDMIIRGGENLFPREIEDVIVMHTDVAEAAVIGVPDAKWGERPVAFVRSIGDSRPDDSDLAGFVRQRIAPHKVPGEWVFVEAFPLNAAGKIQKFILRERYEKEHSG